MWSPYRANRHWFAAWELCRRLLLTGSLTAVSPDRDGEEYLRVAVACLLAGVSLVVGEVARPHRDPWICWIYRVVRRMYRSFLCAGSLGCVHVCVRAGFPVSFGQRVFPCQAYHFTPLRFRHAIGADGPTLHLYPEVYV